jgi:hypothetical protein
MKVRVYVEFIVDEEDSTMAEAEVEAQLNDMVSSNSATVISGFQILDSENIETESVDDDF